MNCITARAKKEDVYFYKKQVYNTTYFAKPVMKLVSTRWTDSDGAFNVTAGIFQ